MIFKTTSNTAIVKSAFAVIICLAAFAGCDKKQEMPQPDPQKQEEPQPQPPQPTKDTVHVTSIRLEQKELILEKGQQMALFTEILPDNADDPSLKWSSSKPEVATVAESGIVTAVEYGQTDIIVTAVDGGLTDTCRLTVPSEYYVCGRITYDDGAAASGITVSDGFVVTRTDKNGKYTLTARADTRHIYFSYPSDAVITKNAEGLPDFFKDFNKSKHQYDFTIKRGAVENSFYIFAMADPQAHNAKRSPQKIADAVRFGTESVPAINAQIAQKNLPCYGITLGDIVYSENNRDSNKAMAVMRGYFSHVEMPVFHVMGNHDYTFYKPGAPIAPNSTSSSINLVTQRKFEDCFGPINYSFNRGNVHFVCMKNVHYTSTATWEWNAYKGGFTDEQYQWLKGDLENVAKGSRVIICVHVPFVHCSTSGPNVSNVLNLLKQYNTTSFSGHAHYYRGVANVLGSGIYEYVHNAVCGQWWWSNISGDGAPNGYSIYEFQGKDIKDSYFIGVNDKMNTREYQMRIYKGNLKTGGSHAYFQWPFDNKTYLINVFAGDSRWTVNVFENGVFKGKASMMSNSKKSFSSVTAGTTYDIPSSSNQDWWSIGYHIGNVGRGTTSTSYYTNMFHMWKYVASSPDAKISVEATDQYGNVYQCNEVITDGLNYPDYIKVSLDL